MLQQTQVATVSRYYERWLRRFPDFATLAGASENDVLHAWQGLGYYTRARNLHATAKMICAKYGAQCPREVDELRSLPGIARYTANAIASFAFDQPVAVVDANIGRVLARLFNVSMPIDSVAGRNVIWDFAGQLIPNNDPAILNSALMDLGSTVCIARTPKCGVCPVNNFCRAKDPAILPVKRMRPPLKRLFEVHAFIVRQNEILLEQSAKRWSGMWILPPLRARSPRGRPIHTSTFPFTHYRVKLAVFRQDPPLEGKTGRWFSVNEMNSIPLPSPHRRAIAELLKK
jgi:A/G-specific adenine glycosylase